MGSVYPITSLCVSRSCLVLDPGPDHPEVAPLFISLAPPQAGESELDALITFASRSTETRAWIRLDIEEPPPLTLEDKLDISGWIPPHPDWMGPEFMERFA
jgi:hypothetical protein